MSNGVNDGENRKMKGNKHERLTKCVKVVAEICADHVLSAKQKKSCNMFAFSRSLTELHTKGLLAKADTRAVRGKKGKKEAVSG